MHSCLCSTTPTVQHHIVQLPNTYKHAHTHTFQNDILAHSQWTLRWDRNPGRKGGGVVATTCQSEAFWNTPEEWRRNLRWQINNEEEKCWQDRCTVLCSSSVWNSLMRSSSSSEEHSFPPSSLFPASRVKLKAILQVNQIRQKET